MIKATLRDKYVPKDLITIHCGNCGKQSVFFRDEIDTDGYTYCTKCKSMLPDAAALIYTLKARVVHHVRHSEHFLR